MLRILSVLTIAFFIASSSYAGWFGDAVKNGLQRAGERGVNEAIDSSYDGAKSAGKEAVASETENSEAAPAPKSEVKQAPQDSEPARVSITGQPDFKEGQWEITTRMEMPGMGMAMPAVVFKSCLTKEDMIPQERKQADNCRVIELNVDGDKVSWVSECTMENGATNKTRGEVVYQKNSFDGTVVMDINDPQNGPMHMTTKMNGKHIGPCPEQK